MCFSAQASFTAGAALAVVGTATVIKARKNDNKHQTAFAAIPLIFAIQQLTEGFVWLSFTYQWPVVQNIAAHIFAFFAYVWWPVFIPLAIGLVEIIVWRKRAINVLWFIGLATGGYLLYYISAYPVVAHVVNSCIAYRIESPLDFRSYSVAIYVLAVLGPMFISSRKIITMFGAVTGVAFVVTYFFFRVAFVSVWCFFAAILSAIIYFYFFKKPA
jgi:hypothetical protein